MVDFLILKWYQTWRESLNKWRWASALNPRTSSSRLTVEDGSLCQEDTISFSKSRILHTAFCSSLVSWNWKDGWKTETIFNCLVVLKHLRGYCLLAIGYLASSPPKSSSCYSFSKHMQSTQKYFFSCPSLSLLW